MTKTDTPVWIEIAKLKPHPGNPRLVKREEIIESLAQQMKVSGFDLSNAIRVRPLGRDYQIVSGHNRVEAAARAGLKEVPAWVREMDDEAAFMELVLCNTQSELSPLERGMHALAATEKGRMNGHSVNAYAQKVGRPGRTVQWEVSAARVAQVCNGCKLQDLVARPKHLVEIHSAPEHCWSVLVERMLASSWTVEQTKAFVKTVLDIKPTRGYEKLFPLEKLQELTAAGQDAAETVSLGTRAIERGRSDIRDVQFAIEEHLAQLEAWLAEHGAWDHRAIAVKAAELAEAQRALRAAAQVKAAKLKRPVTLAEWKTLPSPEREAMLHVTNPKAHLNKQATDAIEWARWSWNPITGCEHNCPYCYARDIAERFYPQKFEPSFIPEALSAPANTPVPKEAAADLGWKNIFTCSMADLFGNWVPVEWIETVLLIMRRNPQWNFLVLTKFPQRLSEFEFPPNVWVGTTIDLQARVPNAERALRKVKASVKWVSIEPLIEPIEMDFSLVQWAVIGGASASSQTPEWRPPRRWVIHLTGQAMAAGCAVYHKTNLNLERLRSYPGGEESEPQQAPDAFHYLKKDAKDELIRILAPVKNRA